MTLPTQPHAIFSTLQGTQNSETKLIKSATGQRAAIANAQGKSLKFNGQPIASL